MTDMTRYFVDSPEPLIDKTVQELMMFDTRAPVKLVLWNWFYHDMEKTYQLQLNGLHKEVKDIIKMTAKEVVETNKSSDWNSEMKREGYKQQMRKILQNFTVGCVEIHKNDPVSKDISEDHVFAWFQRVAMDYWSRHGDHEMLRKLSSLFNLPAALVLKDHLFKRYQKYSQHKDWLVDSIFMSGLGHVLKNFLKD